MIIELEKFEMETAIAVGVKRCTESWSANRKHAAGYKPRDLFDTNIKAAASEMAFAKMIGAYWDGSVNTFKSQPDVLPDWEVRMSMMVPACLIIRPNDKQDRKYVCMKSLWVHGGYPKFKYLGWHDGDQSKIDKKYFHTGGNSSRPPCYFIPLDQLTQEI